jgi:hypothetical protein
MFHMASFENLIYALVEIFKHDHPYFLKLDL